MGKEGTREALGLTKAGTKEEKIGLAHHEELTNYNTSPTIELPATYDVLEELGFGKYQLQMIAIIGTIIVSDSAQMFILSLINPSLICKWNLSLTQSSLISVVFMLFYMAGSSVGGKLSDIHGRRKTFIYSGLFLCISQILVCGMPNYYCFMFMYGFTGLFIGCRYSLSVTYLSEISPINKRTFSIFTIKFFWVLGGILETFIGYIVMRQLGYKWQIVISSLLCLVSLILVFYLSESPRWLLAHGHLDCAKFVIEGAARLNGKHINVSNLKCEVEKDENDIVIWKMTSWQVFLQIPLRSTVCCALIMFSATFLYFSLIYLNTELHLFDYCGIGVHKLHTLENNSCHELDSRDYLDLLITCVVELPAMMFAIFLAEYFGRLWSLRVMSVMGSISTVLLLCCITSSNAEAQLFVSRGFVDGLLVVLWVYIPEIYPTKIRNLAVGLMNTIGKTGAVLGIFIVQYFSGQYPHATIAACFFLCIISLICAILLNKETKDQPLTEAEE